MTVLTIGLSSRYTPSVNCRPYITNYANWKKIEDMDLTLFNMTKIYIVPGKGHDPKPYHNQPKSRILMFPRTDQNVL